MKNCYYLLFFFLPFFAFSQQTLTWKDVYQKGDSLLDEYNFKAAMPFYEQALLLAEKEFGLTSEQYLETRNSWGQCIYTEYSKEKTEKILLDNLSLCKKYGEKSTLYAQALHILGSYYTPFYRGNDAAKSEKYLKQALALRKEISGEKTIEYCNTLNNIALVYDAVGNYTAAEPLYRQCIELTKELIGTKNADYTISVNNLADLYYSMGNYAASELLYKESLAIEREILDPKNPEYANTLINFANVYYGIGNYAAAEPFYKEALLINREVLGEKHSDYGFALTSLATLYVAMGNYFAAEKLYKEAIKVFKVSTGEKHRDYVSVLQGLGTLYQKMGNYAAANLFLQQSTQITKEILGEKHQYYADGLYSLASLKQIAKQRKEAKMLYKLVLQTNKEQIIQHFPSLSEKEKTDYYNNKIKVCFDNFNAFAIQPSKNTATNRPQNNLQTWAETEGLVSQLYDLQLFSKAILLQSSQGMKNRIKDSKDTVLIKEYENWVLLHQDLANYQQMSKDELTEGNINLDSLAKVANEIEKNLSLRSELFAKLTDKKIIKWTDVQAKLRANEAAIEIIRINKFGLAKIVKDTSNREKYPNFPSYKTYSLTDTVYYVALIVKKNSKQPEMVLLTNGNELEKRSIKIYRNSILYKIKDKESYNNFWAKIQANLKGIKKVYFSPDGIYNQVNLNTLYDLQQKKYLQELIEIRQVTNTKDILAFSQNPQKLKELKNFKAELFGRPAYNMDSVQYLVNIQIEKSQNQNYLALRDIRSLRQGNFTDLLGTEKEVYDIDSLMKNNDLQSQKYLLSQATEDRIKRLNSPTILHVATHGFFIADSTQKSPMLHSGILLSGVANYYHAAHKLDTDDGILTAYEAQNMNLDNTELVVLSACETGLGDIRHGEGVYGLQRAFKVAGAKSILMSLWKVDDKVTQELMTTFYQYYMQTSNKRQAFHQAQAQIRAKYPNPFYWGAFVMVGE
jgi:CHAT domain-containing protein